MARTAFLPGRPGRWIAAALLTAGLGACAGDGFSPTPAPQAPIASPPSIPPAAIAGRWGLAAFHRDEDRLRTEQQARAVCSNPYVIGLGPNGGVIMHLADEPQAQELAVKGLSGNRTFVGPAGEPAGPQDREIISYDGQVMIMRWLDPEIASRYGTIVFARCPEAPARTPARPPAKR